MGKPRLNIGILTSSRADYGIYQPLLHALSKDPIFKMDIIAFGSHLKKAFGYTVNQIKADGFEVKYQIDNLIQGDSALDISKSYGNTINLFAEFWNKSHTNFDFVVCLGDRFEMAAAVNAGIPFNVPFAHLHAGETSEGAIDNIYRDQISLASKIHFIALAEFKDRVEKLIHKKATTTLTGAISLENIKSLPLLNLLEFKSRWNIDLSIPSILITVHPETIDYERNHKYSIELEKVITHLSGAHQLVITMPNADTMGSVYRKVYQKLDKKSKNICLVENLGSQSYYSAMKMCKIILGNSSSGIIEAASFKKYVINVGDRQKNRTCSDNVIHSSFKFEDIIKKTMKYIDKEYDGSNIYSKSNGVSAIIKTLKEF